jgi:hypothetical protein
MVVYIIVFFSGAILTWRILLSKIVSGHVYPLSCIRENIMVTKDTFYCYYTYRRN